jgi:glycerophosphoryl diester phosphodiesterase
VRKRTMAYWTIGAAIIGFSALNASWIAPVPEGKPKLIAHRGVYHLYDKRAAVGRDTCTAQFIKPPEHKIFENTVASIQAAGLSRADMVEVDVAPTKDGRMVLFHDWTVDCRTEGKGETRDLTLAQLKALDIGYGYTADGGKTFPLRGAGRGKMPTVEEGLAAAGRRPLLFNFKSKDAGEAEQLFAILSKAGRDPLISRDAFYGAQGPVDRIRALAPGVWAWSTQEVKACTKAYLTYGWTGATVEPCRNGTLAIPINYQWAYWGWPNRLMARMEAIGARIIVMGPYESGKSNEGLTEATQLGKIPSTFNGYIWAEDIAVIGPSLRPE